MSLGGKFLELEEKSKGLSKELVKLKTQVDLKESSIADENKNAANLNESKLEVCNLFFIHPTFARSFNRITFISLSKR